jgi:LPS sulfotransferase NodH
VSGIDRVFDGTSPIFVVGAPRSGTTLLRVMLSSHSRIYIPPESDFIPRLFRRHAQVLMSPKQAARNLRIVLGYRRFFREWRATPLDPASFTAGLSHLTPAAFLNALYSAYADQYGAARWGDKSPIYTRYVDLLAEIFPAAQFVHLIRDGRDAALSALAAYRDRPYVDIYFGARTWRERVQAAHGAGLALGSKRYLEVRYEDLTTDPQAVLRELCEFLGETYEPAMCEPHKLGKELLRPRGRHAPVRQPLRPNSGRWRREMSPTDQRLFTAVAGELLQELRYDVVDLGEMPASERVRVARLATKYRMLEGGRRVLQALGVFPPH